MSTYSRPSASYSRGPVPAIMNRGVPPTARNARTGEFTPPGVTAWARSNRACEAGASYGWVTRPVSQPDRAAAVRVPDGCDGGFTRTGDTGSG